VKVKLALMTSDLDLFAMVLGYVCVAVTLASRDVWEDGSDVERDIVSSVGNYSG
jgi:hypothetical protein